jgi:PEP-CTERM motif
MQKTSTLKRLARRLLTTTCLTAAAATMAVAGPYTGPYGSTMGTAPDVGTSTPVSGSENVYGQQQWFEFTGLTAGTTITIQDLAGSGSSLNWALLSDTSVSLASNNLGVGASVTPSFSLPGDGNVFVEIVATNESGNNWQVTLNPGTSTPEPGTLGAVGIGLAGLGALARRRRKS